MLHALSGPMSPVNVVSVRAISERAGVTNLRTSLTRGTIAPPTTFGGHCWRVTPVCIWTIPNQVNGLADQWPSIIAVNMPAAQYDFDLEQGATFDYTLTWVDQQNTPINLTGYTARMQFRPGTPDNPVVALELTSPVSGGVGITLGGVAGTIRLQATAALTAALTAVPHSYDLELTDGAGVVTRLIRGIANVTREVTR